MSFPSQDNETYLSRVHDLAFSWGLEDVVESLSKPDTASTKAFYINYAQRLTISTPAQITAATSELDGNIGRYTVCIVENIAPEHIEALGSAWDLDPAFFVQYASNRQREHLWMPDVFGGDRPGTDRKPYDHIDGNFEYHGICVQSDAELNSAPNYFARHCFRKTWDEVETVNSNTRISYYRVHRELYLFLVDAPLHLQDRYSSMPRRVRPTLRLPYAVNRGGLLLPQLLELYDRQGFHYSIFESLKSVFKHGWQRSLLFSHEDHVSRAFPAPPLCYMLSNSLWQTNLQYLTREIRRISFEEIRNPDLRINETLHDRREDLVAFLKAGLAETTTYLPQTIIEYWEDLRQSRGIMQDATNLTPVSAHYNTLEKAVELEKFLMETFQLLMSSISVQDAKMSVAQGQLSNQQSLRATQLTILASIYVPLSFVTGIFGMNLKELNGSSLSIWVFFVGVVIATIVTAIIFLGLQVYSKKGENKDNGKEPSEHKADQMKKFNLRKQRKDVGKEPKAETSMA